MTWFRNILFHDLDIQALAVFFVAAYVRDDAKIGFAGGYNVLRGVIYKECLESCIVLIFVKIQRRPEIAVVANAGGNPDRADPSYKSVFRIVLTVVYSAYIAYNEHGRTCLLCAFIRADQTAVHEKTDFIFIKSHPQMRPFLDLQRYTRPKVP